VDAGVNDFLAFTIHPDPATQLAGNEYSESALG